MLTTKYLLKALFCTLSVCLFLAPSPAPAAPEAPQEFTVIAGNAFHDHTPDMGVLCTFDFGDPAGAYNVLTGFNAAHIYRTPGNYTMKVSSPAGNVTRTIHVLPDQRAVLAVRAGDSISNVVRGLQQDTIVLLPAGSTWDVAQPLDLNARNIEFRPAGPGPAPRFRRIRGVGHTTFTLHGLNITFRGIEFDSDQNMRIVGDKKLGHKGVTVEAANVVFDGCTFRNIDDAIFGTKLTRNLLVQSCTFTDEVRACDVWMGGANIVLLGNKMATSQHEHNCRANEIGFYNLLVYDNDITATHGKETLTFRIGQDLYAAHNAFHGWVRVGPGPKGKPMPAAELRYNFVRFVLIERNALLDGAWMQINEGSTHVIFRQNRIDVNPKQVAVAVQGPSLHDIVVEDNYRVLTEGPTQKPFMVMRDTGPNDIIERGTKTKTLEEETGKGTENPK